MVRREQVLQKLEEIENLSSEIYPQLKRIRNLARELGMDDLVRFLNGIVVGIDDRLPDFE